MFLTAPLSRYMKKQVQTSIFSAWAVAIAKMDKIGPLLILENKDPQRKIVDLMLTIVHNSRLLKDIV